eukprot:3742501-Heterocapsa_arctica.AAC.1
MDGNNCIKPGDNYQMAQCAATMEIVGPVLVTTRGGCPAMAKEMDMLAFIGSDLINDQIMARVRLRDDDP